MLLYIIYDINKVGLFISINPIICIKNFSSRKCCAMNARNISCIEVDYCIRQYFLVYIIYSKKKIVHIYEELYSR